MASEIIILWYLLIFQQNLSTKVYLKNFCYIIQTVSDGWYILSHVLAAPPTSSNLDDSHKIPADNVGASGIKALKGTFPISIPLLKRILRPIKPPPCLPKRSLIYMDPMSFNDKKDFFCQGVCCDLQPLSAILGSASTEWEHVMATDWRGETHSKRYWLIIYPMSSTKISYLNVRQSHFIYIWNMEFVCLIQDSRSVFDMSIAKFLVIYQWNECKYRGKDSIKENSKQAFNIYWLNNDWLNIL